MISNGHLPDFRDYYEDQNQNVTDYVYKHKMRKLKSEDFNQCTTLHYVFKEYPNHKLVIDNKEIKLTPLEFKLLSLFLENQNQVLLKERIIEKIWDVNENYVDEHTLLVTISRLRNKIEDDKHHYIKTVYGLGYRWCHDE